MTNTKETKRVKLIFGERVKETQTKRILIRQAFVRINESLLQTSDNPETIFFFKKTLIRVIGRKGGREKKHQNIKENKTELSG